MQYAPNNAWVQYLLYAHFPSPHHHHLTHTVEAASPESYTEFMQILCNYIVEKQREVQGEELPFDLVFVSLPLECVCVCIQCIYTVKLVSLLVWSVKTKGCLFTYKYT